MEIKLEPCRNCKQICSVKCWWIDRFIKPIKEWNSPGNQAPDEIGGEGESKRGQALGYPEEQTLRQ